MVFILVAVLSCGAATVTDRESGPAVGDEGAGFQSDPLVAGYASGGVLLGGAVGTAVAMASFLSTTDGNFVPFLIVAPLAVLSGVSLGPIVALWFFSAEELPGWIGPAAGASAVGVGLLFFVAGATVVSFIYDNGLDAPGSAPFDVANGAVIAGPFIVGVLGATAAAGVATWLAIE